MCEYVFYLLSISFQLCGGIILLLGASSVKRSKVIKRFSNKGLIIRDNNTNKISFNKKAFCNEFKTAILNKLAFILLSMGYFFSIFGNIGEYKKNYTAIIVLLIVAFIVRLLKLASFLISKKISEKEITNDELRDLKIIPDIENISNNCIDAMFK